MRTRAIIAVCSVALVAIGFATTAAAGTAGSSNNSYKVTRLVSDKPGFAMHTDSNLVNAWGLVAGPATPWWVANNGTDTSTLYDGTGTPIPLVVDVKGAPTGTVFNGGPGFVVSHNGDSGPALFMFATESGTIRGWNPGVPGPAQSTQHVQARRSGRARRDLQGTRDRVDHERRPPVRDRLPQRDRRRVGREHASAARAGRLRRPAPAAGYGPFGIQAIGDWIFVTYAKQDADAEDDVQGFGLGFVDAYSKSGEFLGRVTSRGALNAPWGLAWAPDGFGAFGGDLLVGNFGNGRILGFAPKANGGWSFDGALRRANGNRVGIDGLWAIQFGNDDAAGPSTTLFFTAGPDDEEHGLFGKVEALT